MYNFTYLAPRFNLYLNGSITLFWFLGFGLLTMSLAKSHVLNMQCTAGSLAGPDERDICRDYKALWGMSLVGSYV